MKWILTLSVLTFLSSVLAVDYACPDGKSKKSITIKKDQTFNFDVAPGYGAKTKCSVMYKPSKSKKTKCKKLKFSCTTFDLPNKDAKKCRKGDKLKVGKQFFCKSKSPSIQSTKPIKLMFLSDKKDSSGSATCTIECVGSTPAPSPSPPTTTTGPTTTTAEPVPCVNCTIEDGRLCQFPFIYKDVTYTKCSMVDDTRPWCSTKVDQFNKAIPGVGEWGYCNSDCPSDDGFPASGSGPACQVRTTGYGYPDTCAERMARPNKNILFIGNSYTYGNDLPGMVKNLASAAGKSASTTMVAPGGQTLSGHVSGGTLNTIRGGDWDAVVIQDQSQRPSFGASYVYANIVPDADAIVDAIRETNPCTMPVYYLTWGKRDGDSQNCGHHEVFCSFEGIQDQLTQAYTTMAYVTQPASVAPAGEAWRNYGNRNSLFAGDGSHASSSGTYLTACTMLETIWPDVSSVGNSYRPVGDASALQDLAHQTVTSRVWSWPEAGPRPCEGCLP